MAGTFDDLNDALFAQMNRLANADGDALEAEIERSGAVSRLAGNIIANYNTALSLMRMQSAEGMDMAMAVGTAPKMLGGGSAPAKAPAQSSKVTYEVADPWIADNAPKHTVTYMADRLGWTHEEVVSACDRLGVSAKSLDGRAGSWGETSEKQKQRKRAGL